VLSGLENPVHLLVIAVVVLILFGPARLPSIGRAVGSGIRELKDSFGGGDENKSEKP
jgi:sec-independent protein translocase protein TatA